MPVAGPRPLSSGQTEKAPCPALRRLESGVCRLYAGNDGVIYGAVDCWRGIGRRAARNCGAIEWENHFAQQSFISIPSKSKSGGGKLSNSIDGKEQAKETKSNLAIEVPEPEQSLEEVVDKSRNEMEELSRIIMQITSAYNAQSNLQMEVVPQGLRILIQDDLQRDMFQRSSAVLTPFFSRLLGELAPAFNEMDNKIIITGHTDASRYRDQLLYNNWNLSGERALMAHKALVSGGLDKGRVLQINAMADQMLLDPTDPLAAKTAVLKLWY